VNTPTIPEHQKRRLQAHFAFTRVPFRKNMHAAEMFDSRSQRELLHGLLLWLEIRGLALVTGESGVGKSITFRRFVQTLDEARFRVIHLTNMPTTTMGFLRSLNRALSLPMRQHAADLFDQAHAHLTAHGDDGGPHPLLVLDDAEGIRPALLDLLRRLTAYSLDAEDRFSVLISGTDALLRTLRDPTLEPFVTRISFASTLKPFSLEDTRNYVTFHVQRAGARDRLFSDDAIRRIFLASQGAPRRVNQLALHVLIQAAVIGQDTIGGDFVATQHAAHPHYDAPGGSP
jgi:type II secretory pathway predicted ATPase ExeA